MSDSARAVSDAETEVVSLAVERDYLLGAGGSLRRDVDERLARAVAVLRAARLARAVDALRAANSTKPTGA